MYLSESTIYICFSISDTSVESQYKHWLKECYETAWVHTLQCIKHGRTNSRLQALVTACKMMQAEGKYPLETTDTYFFPVARLKVQKYIFSNKLIYYII